MFFEVVLRNWVISLVVVLLSIAAYFWHRVEKRRRLAAARKWALELEARRLAEENRLIENAQRKELRREWIKEHGITLYYHVVNGIMVVLTPAAYEACKSKTELALRDGKWDKTNTLLPTGEAFVFVDTRGWRLFSSNHGTVDPVRHGWVSGWFSDMDSLCDTYNVHLEHKMNIFVPYLNESVLTFTEQAQYQNQRSREYKFGLVALQTPKEMHPIP